MHASVQAAGGVILPNVPEHRRVSGFKQGLNAQHLGQEGISEERHRVTSELAGLSHS